ncbi:MAG: hypothetical protein AAF403_07135 [Pseudomonadota bacterium]
MRLGTQLFLWGIIISLSTYTLFYISWQVKEQEREYARLARKLDEKKQIYAGLEAEWSHLSRPSRIEQLALKFFPDLELPVIDQIQVMDFPRLSDQSAQNHESGYVAQDNPKTLPKTHTHDVFAAQDEQVGTKNKVSDHQHVKSNETSKKGETWSFYDLVRAIQFKIQNM